MTEEQRINKNAYMRNWYKNNPHSRAYKVASGLRHLKSWEGYIPVQTNCEICGTEIFYNQGNINKAIHFDHRGNGVETIKVTPKNWLQSHQCTPKNQEIWKINDFGYLCGVCNRYLPTKNRKQWLENVIKYVNQ